MSTNLQQILLCTLFSEVKWPSWITLYKVGSYNSSAYPFIKAYKLMAGSIVQTLELSV